MMKIKKVILSRGRYDSISTHKLVTDTTLICIEEEKDLYKKVFKNDIICIPSNIVGLGKIRNWILNKFTDECVIMFDDDIRSVINATHKSPVTIYDPETINLIIENTANNANEAGCKLFGFNQSCDVRKYRNNEPFLFRSWVGGVVGIIDRDIPFNEVNKFKVDIDYCLEHLKKYRKLWIENRFGFVQKRDNNAGGSSLFRKTEDLKREMEYLKNKWGKYIRISENKRNYFHKCR